MAELEPVGPAFSGRLPPPAASGHAPTFANFAKDCFSGTVGGIVVVFVGHPFDTLKVRLQTQPSASPVYSGLGDCFRQTVAQEGLGGLYRGMSSPLTSQMFLRALHFSSFGQSKGFYERSAAAEGRASATGWEYFKAGGMAGAAVTVMEGPSDLYKSQLQVQKVRALSTPGYVPPFHSLIGAVRASFAASGARAPFQGFGITLLRNIPANATYFGSFEVMRRALARARGEEVADLPLPMTMAVAGTAGCLYWLAIYPLDVLKSSIQGDAMDPSARKYGAGIVAAARTLWAEGGVPRFFRGFTPCLMRALPANAAMLTTVDRVQTFLKKKAHEQ